MPESPLRDHLSCVIFDIDGTLARSNDLVFASFNHVAEKYLGKRLSDKEIIALFGPPEEGGLRRLLDERLVPGALEELYEFYESKHAAMASLHDGIEDLLKLLSRNGIRLAAFTGKGRKTATITLEQLGIIGYFDVLMSGSDVEMHKPHPEGILRILEEVEVSSEHSLMVGDSVSDVRSSRAAGVASASVLWDCYDREAVIRENPDYRFETVSGLKEWLADRIARTSRVDQRKDH